METNITITTQKEAGISDEALYDLIQQSFRQWLDVGIDEPFLHFTLEEFKRTIHDAIVFVANDTVTGELLGTHTFQPKQKENYIHGCFLAVAPKAQHKGIATRMIQFESEYFRKANYNYLRGFTSVNAVWSIKWHRKNGYHIIGYFLPTGGNQYNYIFRKQLKPSLVWSWPLAPITAGIHFYKSYAIIKYCKDSAGQLNIIGRGARKIKHLFRL